MDGVKPVFLECWPGGLETFSGGTRTQVKLRRPWQRDIEGDPAECQLCTRVQKEVGFEREGGEWWGIIENLFTPLSFHRMVLPKEHWDKDRMRRLGGRAGILSALNVVDRQVRRSGTPSERLYVAVHVGALAGQTQSHLHWNFYKPPSSRAAPESEKEVEFELREAWKKNPSLRLFEHHGLAAFVGGIRAGQCFIVRKPGLSLPDFPGESLGELLGRITELYADRFRSDQGLAPDYMIGAVIKQSRWLYAVYVPILNQWGVDQQLCLLEGTPLVLPWPHRETVRHLRP